VIGKVETANGGTLFLDEIGELPLPLQGKLLRFVQERQFERVGATQPTSVDVRIIAATNRNLEAMVAQGQFREDLYFRLRVVEIEIPPLRTRGEADINDLAEHFVQQFSRRYRKGPLRLAESTRPAIVAYTWPGNVRELENTIERAVVLAAHPTISIKDLGLDRQRLTNAGDSQVTIPVIHVPPVAPPTAQAPAPTEGVIVPYDITLEEVERRYAKAALDRENGNQSAAARTLGISRNKLSRLIKGDQTDDDE
jgi:Nif-specific regulatory protein